MAINIDTDPEALAKMVMRSIEVDFETQLRKVLMAQAERVVEETAKKLASKLQKYVDTYTNHTDGTTSVLLRIDNKEIPLD